MTESPKRILIVDDEPGVVDVLTDYFTHQYGKRGWVVEAAMNGPDGLAAVMRNRPDLVLLDIDMPGMTGVEVLTKIHALDRSIPVMMITGNASVRIAGQVIAAGATSYVPKPFNFQYLEHMVESLLLRPGESGTTRPGKPA